MASDVARVLTIAGSDSGGGAGIQADLKTFHAFGCYGMSVITAVTAQNTLGVQAIAELAPDFVASQIDSVLSDLGADAVKVGMLSNTGIVSAVSGKLAEYAVPNLVIDPVMRSTGGSPLLPDDAQETLKEHLVPLAYLVTPNIPEAEVLARMSIHSIADMKTAAEKIQSLGAAHVLVKGGHRKEDATDILFDGTEFREFGGDRVASQNTHGTGCTYAAAIVANLAKGASLCEAIETAKRFITDAIRASFPLGQGIGPLNHFVRR